VSDSEITIAVTGLNATDNPGPGIPVIRSIREIAGQKARVIGLLYDTLEPGAFMRDQADRHYMMPYPSSGLEAVFDRLKYIHSREHLDLILPTLDTELYVFYKLKDRLAELGIRTFLPSTDQLNMRGKDALSAFCVANGIKTPKTRIVQSTASLQTASQSIGFPLMVKGIFYGAQKVQNFEELVAAFNKTRDQWGLPIILQEYQAGDEFNVAALGDGAGGTVGAVAMRKTVITDKGKGWAGVTIFDSRLLDLARTMIRHLKWAGGLELEFIKSGITGEFSLLEINPRFPAWVYLATAAGQNLPAAWMDLARGIPVTPFEKYDVGKMFVRCSWDLIADLDRLEKLTVAGEA
jgi:carbamoyl-phosphate synthase large subunit